MILINIPIKVINVRQLNLCQIGGQRWNVQLGRRDSTTASLDESNSDLPAPFLDLDGLITAFAKKNFTEKEMVTLSGK